MNQPVPILMYHQVAPRPAETFRKYTVTPRAFAAQMAWLALAGYAPVTLDRLVEARGGGRALPPRAVVITFDDGFQGCADYAVPVLRARGFTAVFFIVAGLVGGTSAWLLAERGVELAMMGWPTIRALDAAGFQIGAHTMSHPRLAGLAPADCRRELGDSRRRLEDELGRAVRHMAYPFGSYDEAARAAAAEAGYRSACSVRIGLSPAGDDPLALRRVPVLGQDSLLDFACRLRTAWPLSASLRSGAGRARGWLRREPRARSL